MSVSHSPKAFTPDDYALIVAAMQESARGRWFLAEFAARSRAADARALIDAVGRLENVVGETGAAGGFVRAGEEIAALAGAIARAKAEVAAIDGEDPRYPAAVPAEVAHARVLDAAEELQDLAWAFREHGAAAEACDALDQQAAAISAAAAGQDRALRRTRRMVRLLCHLEDRLAVISGRAGLPFPAGPAWPDAPCGRDGEADTRGPTDGAPPTNDGRPVASQEP